MLEKNTLGDRIKEYRKKVGISQQELADKLFVSDKTISSWEKNRTEPDLDTLAKLADLFSTRITDLAYGTKAIEDIETEIKIKVTEKEFHNLRILLENQATFQKKIQQKDTYYTPEYHDFTKEKYPYEWLRIGKRGNKVIVNYKHWYPEGVEKNTHCDEYEVEIDNAINMDRIFKCLHLRDFAVVDKERSIFLYQNKYEFSLDKVVSLGYFVEIEVKKYEGTPLEEYENLLKVASSFQLDIKNLDRRGYPYYFIEK